ncbi:hypothetical protein [Rubinisphaera sp.]|uniref:hypothetical protein n=1 Tax=Rubinisphaera sp. TaxID=2024857 RepID=UPI000C0EB157|nr:hypothetical protein [Rubinisphaera sp.]MBV08389.1 hypothetical protein [Rubinisphaera sp.]HCS55583.1 hypothetical protein [Planctomycetaceae bacterium]
MKSHLFVTTFLILMGLISGTFLILYLTGSLGLSGNQILFTFTYVDGDFGIDTETHLIYMPVTTCLLTLFVLSMISSALICFTLGSMKSLSK